MVNPLIVANWKMYGDLASYKSVIRELAQNDVNLKLENVDVVICPPFPYLGILSSRLPGGIWLGAQYISTHAGGAYTGEVSAQMVRELGARYTLIGHSERREHFQERGSNLAEQLALATEHDLIPIICVGENKNEYDSHRSHNAVRRQLAAILERCHSRVDRLVIAYEPVWAIGSDKHADPDYVTQILQIIDEQVKTYPITQNACLTLLYGGSVGPENAAAYLSAPNVDGLLVGRASLNTHSFRRICESVLTNTQTLQQTETPVA